MKGMVSVSIEKKKKKMLFKEKRRQLRGNKAQAEERKNSPRLHVCSLPLQLRCVCVFTARVCITCVGLLYVLFSPCVCLCVQTCALISFYWHCCVTCWILMWDDLFLPLSSRCSQRYPTCFKNTPCDELEDQREATDYYLAVVRKGNVSHVFIYISFSLWTEAYEREKTKTWFGIAFWGWC